MFVYLALVEVVEKLIIFMELASEIFADKTPMPWFEYIIRIVFWIGEYKTIAVCILKEPLVGGSSIKTGKSATQSLGSEINRGP